MSTGEDGGLGELAETMEHRRKKIATTLDRFYLEIDGPSNEEQGFICLVDQMKDVSTSEEAWNVRDRIEELRAGLYRLRKTSSRNLAEARDAYYDSIRVEKSRGRSEGHYEEREAKYEMKHIHQYKIMRNLERTYEDVEAFSFYLEGRLRWVKDRLRWLREDEQWSRMKY
jgi:hypothetical protein